MSTFRIQAEYTPSSSLVPQVPGHREDRSSPSPDYVPKKAKLSHFVAIKNILAGTSERARMTRLLDHLHQALVLDRELNSDEELQVLDNFMDANKVGFGPSSV